MVALKLNVHRNEGTLSQAKNDIIDKDNKFILQELNVNPYRQFNIIFALMSIIPFLAFIYVCYAFIFSDGIFNGNVTLILIFAFMITIGGYVLGYRLVRKIFDKVILYAAFSRHKDQQKSKFVAFVSHELKTPLAVIRMNLTNLKMGLLGSITNEQTGIISSCENMIERMTKLIQDMLDLYKLEAGVTSLNKKVCNFKEILESQIREFEIIFNQKHVNLSKRIVAEDVFIFADKLHMVEAINNLLSNAAKYTPENGSVMIDVFITDNFVRMEISNTCSGIPKDRINKIFDKFERLDLTKEGTGIGLAITKDIIDMHQGSIWVENNQNRGCTFTVLIPICG